jgi:hypothetical protein
MNLKTEQIDAKYWVKTRNSLDGSQYFLYWTGSIYSLVTNEPKQLLFKIIGMNASRCLLKEENVWDFVSREVNYYLDPQTNQILHSWNNPWTQEKITVMHVANSPVQDLYRGKVPVVIDGDKTTFVFDLFPRYPNPLATEERFLEYSSDPIYQAAELFKITVSTQDLFDEEKNSVDISILTWDRVGSWLPWMKMGSLSGSLLYSSVGFKVKNFIDLPQLLQNEIVKVIPIYQNAPEVRIDTQNMTSWRYFQKHFDAYLAGKEFPLAEE